MIYPIAEQLEQLFESFTDPETGEKYGWGRVLDYIGVGWENKPDTDFVGQYSFEDYEE